MPDVVGVIYITVSAASSDSNNILLNTHFPSLPDSKENWWLVTSVFLKSIHLDLYILGNTVKLHKCLVGCVYGRKRRYLVDFQDGLWTLPSKGIWRLLCWEGKFGGKNTQFYRVLIVFFSLLLTCHGLGISGHLKDHWQDKGISDKVICFSCHWTDWAYGERYSLPQSYPISIYRVIFVSLHGLKWDTTVRNDYISKIPISHTTFYFFLPFI